MKSHVGGTYNALAVTGNTLVPFTLALLLLLDLLVLDLLGLFSATLLVWCDVSLMFLECRLVSYANAFVRRVDIGQGQQGLRDLRRALSLPTLRTDAVWKERTGAETKALLAMKDLESMMVDVLCFLAKLSVNTSQWRSWRERRTWS